MSWCVTYYIMWLLLSYKLNKQLPEKERNSTTFKKPSISHHKHLWMNHILSQQNHIPTPPSSFFQITFNTILPSLPWSPISSDFTTTSFYSCTIQAMLHLRPIDIGILALTYIYYQHLVTYSSELIFSICSAAHKASYSASWEIKQVN